MKKNIFKICLIILVVALCLTLVGCGGEEPGPGGSIGDELTVLFR